MCISTTHEIVQILRVLFRAFVKRYAVRMFRRFIINPMSGVFFCAFLLPYMLNLMQYFLFVKLVVNVKVFLSSFVSSFRNCLFLLYYIISLRIFRHSIECLPHCSPYCKKNSHYCHHIVTILSTNCDNIVQHIVTFHNTVNIYGMWSQYG